MSHSPIPEAPHPRISEGTVGYQTACMVILPVSKSDQVILPEFLSLYVHPLYVYPLYKTHCLHNASVIDHRVWTSSPV